MPGIFSKTARPERPGAYFNWLAQPTPSVLPNIGSVVFLPFTHDWGPDALVVSNDSFAEWQQAFGPSTDTEGYKAARQCFKGEGLPGHGGAGTILSYRMATSSAAKATKALQNTTPADAITVTAVYKGTYGEHITVTAGFPNAQDITKDDFVVKVDGVVVETFTYTAASIGPVGTEGTLGYLINTYSKWLTATVSVNGVALGEVTDTPLTGGNDGTSLTGTEFTSMMDAAETSRFSLFAPADLATYDSGGTILDSMTEWSYNANNNGKRFLTVIGGDASDAVSDAVTRSTDCAGLSHSPPQPNPNFVNLGFAVVDDEELGALTTSQLAPRVAGILAARGETMSLTYARLAGVTGTTLPTESDILQMFDGGVTTLSQDSHPDAPVRIEKGLTVWTSTAYDNLPYVIYRTPKFLRTMHVFETDMTEWAAFNAIGQLQVNDQTRAFVLGYAKEQLRIKADKGIIQQNYSCLIDPEPPPSDMDEFVALLYGVAFGRSVEQIFNTIYIS